MIYLNNIPQGALDTVSFRFWVLLGAYVSAKSGQQLHPKCSSASHHPLMVCFLWRFHWEHIRIHPYIQNNM